MAKPIYMDDMGFVLRFRRAIWGIAYYTLFRPTPRFILGGWRRFLLRRFGAEIGAGAVIAPSCFVWAPWNLRMGVHACLGGGVDCYNQAMITLGDYATVSQRAFLCTASHSISSVERPLVSGPIAIGSHAWVCAEAFVGRGVTIGVGAVIGARSALFGSAEPWQVYQGNPAVRLYERPGCEKAKAEYARLGGSI